MSKIYLMYENEQWSIPLMQALDDINAPFENWPMIDTQIDLMTKPPTGIFFNRMSASAHTRGHRNSPEFTSCVIHWLESNGRRVINGGQTLQLELSKSAQYSLLTKAGINVPITQAIIGTDQFLQTAKNTTTPFIIKHNRAGKGLSVKLIHDIESLNYFVKSDEYEPPVDGIWLIQQYIQAPQPYIIRLEFINAKFVYAVKVNTEQGFELCPADACEIQSQDAFCLIDSKNQGKFEILKDFDHPLIEQYTTFMKSQKLDIAAFEFIVDDNNTCFTYDINTNTNYNSLAEQKVDINAIHLLATFLEHKRQSSTQD